MYGDIKWYLTSRHRSNTLHNGHYVHNVTGEFLFHVVEVLELRYTNQF